MRYLILSAFVVSLIGILLFNPVSSSVPDSMLAFAQTAESEETIKAEIEELGNLESLEELLAELQTMTPQEKQNIKKHIEKFAQSSTLLFEYENLDIEKVRAELLEKINTEDSKKENNLRKEIKDIEKEIRENYIEIRKQWLQIFRGYQNAVNGLITESMLSGDNITVLKITKLKSALPSIESKFNDLEQEKLKKEQASKQADIVNEERKKSEILRSMLERIEIISISDVGKDNMDKFLVMKSSEKLLKNKIKILQKELKERDSILRKEINTLDKEIKIREEGIDDTKKKIKRLEPSGLEKELKKELEILEKEYEKRQNVLEKKQKDLEKLVEKESTKIEKEIKKNTDQIKKSFKAQQRELAEQLKELEQRKKEISKLDQDERKNLEMKLEKERREIENEQQIIEKEQKRVEKEKEKQTTKNQKTLEKKSKEQKKELKSEQKKDEKERKRAEQKDGDSDRGGSDTKKKRIYSDEGIKRSGGGGGSGGEVDSADKVSKKDKISRGKG